MAWRCPLGFDPWPFLECTRSEAGTDRLLVPSRAAVLWDGNCTEKLSCPLTV